MPATGLHSIQSISDITTQIRHTRGDIPPPLVGASVTVLNGHAYVFAGRLVSSRKMTNSLYILDLNTLEWSRHIPTPDSEAAANPRYFHSAEAYQNQIIFFGGMGYSRESADGLCVLDDVSVLDVKTLEWKHHTIEKTLYSPRPRYAHLSSIVENTLVVVGGQDMTNSYIEEINVLDLNTWKWINVKPFEKHVGAYRSIAVTAPSGAHIPTMTSDAGTAATKPTATTMANGNSDQQQQQQVVDGSIYMYSNYNFADVRRELQMISSPGNNTKPIQDYSSLMSGSAMPPGLRFPAGHILGHHLILTGTYLTPQTHSFSIWLMNLSAMSWSRVETGSIFSTGSWNRSILSQDQNKLMVFGHRDRDLLTDYNHRQVNYEHLAVVDMEAFGAYRLPVMTCSPLAQEMGLSLLNEPGVSDFSIITRENSVIPINSAILRRRWPYFDQLMKENVEIVTVKEDTVDDDVIIDTEASTLASTDATAESIAETTTTTQTSNNGSIEDSETVTEATLSAKPAAATAPAADEAGQSTQVHDKPIDQSTSQDVSPQPSITSHLHSEVTIKSHALHFPHTSQVIIAFLQFIYTDNLLTAQQHQPHILSQLLLLADMYDIPRLKDLATHALHQMLNMSTAALIFETAALSHQTSLQIRALKMMIAAKKLIQQQQQQQNSRSSVTVSPRPSIHTPPPSASTVSLESAPQVMNSPRSVASTSSYMSSAATSGPPHRFDSNSRMSLLDQGHYMSSPGHQPGSPNGSIRSRTASLTRSQSTRRSLSGNNQSPYMAFSAPMNPIIPEQDDSDYSNPPRRSTSSRRPNLDLTDEASSTNDESTSSGKKFMSLKKSKKSSDGKEKKPFLEAFSSKLASFAH